jgi:hypothetical protein
MNSRTAYPSFCSSAAAFAATCGADTTIDDCLFIVLGERAVSLGGWGLRGHDPSTAEAHTVVRTRREGNNSTV